MTVSVEVTDIPDRQPDEDESIVLLVLRRQDPQNPNGDALPDLGDVLTGVYETLTPAILDAIANSGFDLSRSYLCNPSTTDAESGGVITVQNLIDIRDSSANPPVEDPPANPPVEDPPTNME